MANYRLSPNAKDDLERIWFYGLERWGQDAADRYLFDLFETLDKIADAPFHYQSVEHIKPDYRRCVFRSDAIYYRIEDEVVEIMAILGRQDQRGWL